MRIKFFLLSIIALALVLSYYTSPELSPLNKQAQISENQITGKYDPTQTKAVFHKKEVKIPAQQSSDLAAVLGSQTNGTKPAKRIEVDLASQRLYAYENDKKVMIFDVSTGKWGATPTGDFKFWSRFEYTLMSGGSTALGTYYYLPNVPYTMFFYNDKYPKSMGYGVHGAYWHDNFGTPMSHGCINLPIKASERLFYWADLDTPLKIYGKAPNS